METGCRFANNDQEKTAMPEALKILIMIAVIVAVLYLALRIAGWQMRKACDFIIEDLRTREALDPSSAVTVTCASNPLLRIGLRDYRPRALEYLVQQDVVRVLEGGRYYLREGYKLDGQNG